MKRRKKADPAETSLLEAVRSAAELRAALEPLWEDGTLASSAKVILLAMLDALSDYLTDALPDDATAGLRREFKAGERAVHVKFGPGTLRANTSGRDAVVFAPDRPWRRAAPMTEMVHPIDLRAEGGGR